MFALKICRSCVNIQRCLITYNFYFKPNILNKTSKILVTGYSALVPKIMDNPIVEVAQGKLKGGVSKDSKGGLYYIFKGIPYAKPPIGELRFSTPEPPESWEGVKDATEDCNICVQYDRQTGGLIGDEDCLYLNVFTPKLPAGSFTSLPVMLFIHGGGFVYGQGTNVTVHGPDHLIPKDVVVVTINYRLGVLGFLALDCKEAPGNMGLRDQVQALKWVQENISKFGGDPSNVTIFGISAGGSSVEYLMLSPLAEGLFHKAIAQSGSSLLSWAQNNDVKDLAVRIPALKGKNITENKQLLEYLKEMPIEDLIKSSITVINSVDNSGGIYFGFVPTVEKNGDWEPFLNESTYKTLSKGEFAKVPFMTGFCSREGLIMVPLGVDRLKNISEHKRFLQYLPFNIDDAEKADIESKVKSAYMQQERKYKDEDEFAIDYFTDVDFLGGIYVAATLIARNSSPVYFYEFAYDGALNYLKKKYNISQEGACHGDDGGYLVKSNILPDTFSDKDALVKDRIVTMWTNFAKYGDPTPMLDDVIVTKWEPIPKDGMACLVIDEKTEIKREVYAQRMKIFQELYEKYYDAK